MTKPQKRSLSETRRFSTQAVLRELLLDSDSIAVYTLHFEAGQCFQPAAGEASYQVLEGDAVLRYLDGETPGSESLRKGQILIGQVQEIDNPAGGLLVMLESRSK